MLFNDHAVERCAQLVAIECRRAVAGANGGQLLLRVLDTDLRFLQRVAGAQIILLRRDLLFPELLLAVISDTRQIQTFLC